nr:hypothetical protein BaRGS_030438 [Batillaria attramentaria]
MAQTYWLPGTDRNNSNGVIVYQLGDFGYGWTLVDPGAELPYICQVARAEAYRVVQDDRDYDYGLMVTDYNTLLRGPHFTLQPVSTVVVGTPELAELECIADANPPPSYKWFRGENFEVEVTSEMDSRYTLTNGKLIIQDPREGPDANTYRCTAENVLGLVISNDVELSFGDLGEFSNVPDAGVNAKAYDGVAIECSKITFKPAVKYNWFKESTVSFVRPTFQTYQFMSQNGKLYMSEVTRADEGRYHCIAILTGVNRYTIGTNQPPTRTSLAIPLYVHDQAPKADWGPEIQDDFIAVFPQPPLKGQDVRLECFAYGSSTTPFHYSWSREGKPLPEGYRLSDHNRVLTIPDARLEDQGVYTCHVSRSTNARDSKSINLSLGARPYFISKLRDQHVDVNSQLTWRCDARANPPASYTWYKNGEVVTSDPTKGIQVSGNVMRISRLDPKLHDGMYQCGAVNVYGMTLSEGQLRVLSFPPTFEKHPLMSKIKAAQRGNATITCSPEGAPAPVIEWYKNGGVLGTDGNRIIQLPNGNLVIQNVMSSDQGRYTCKATNEFGEASSSTVLTMAMGTSITVAPVNTRVSVNSTAFLSCVASYDPLMDLVYNWYFNGHLLDIDHRPDLRKVRRGPRGNSGLYILTVDFIHAGYYECKARTTLNHDSRGAYLTVLGPPAEPTGCYVDGKSVSNGSVEILWTPGADNGRPISRYVIEMANSFDKNHWYSVFSDMPHRISTEPISNERKRARVTDLSPGNGYRYRVVAVNQFGRSIPSVPSAWIYMPSAPPAIPPRDLSGGGGSVGDLTITWTPLEPWEESGDGIGYKVYWRKFGEINALFNAKELQGFNDHYVAFVGVENYFLEYEVKVQAFNNMGYGPNSSVEIVFSAEDRVLCALINYWLQRNIATDWKEFIRVEGHVGEGIFIGLESDTNYICEVRAYNSAGLGPRSETYLIETLHLPAQHYPEEVRVYSAGHGQVLVWWRGIHTLQVEENVHGWVMYFWPANEHYRSACEMLIHDHHAHETHITVDPGVVYALRLHFRRNIREA